MADPASRAGLSTRLRRLTAVAAFLAAFACLTGGNPLPDFRARLAILRRSWGESPAVRRREGSAAAYDRRFAAVIESARNALPPGTPGLALDAPGIPEWGGLYLAVYEFAPIPVVLAPGRAPRGWLVLAYPPAEPPGGRVVRRFAGGALVLPSP